MVCWTSSVGPTQARLVIAIGPKAIVLSVIWAGPLPLLQESCTATCPPANRSQAIALGSTAETELAELVLLIKPTTFQPVSSSAAAPDGAGVNTKVSVPLVNVSVPSL